MMEHYIIHKDKKAYCSFPRIDYHSDEEIYVGFFAAPVADHYGIYDWMLTKSTDGGETWKQAKCKDTNLYWNPQGKINPRAISDRFLWNEHVIGSAGFKKLDKKILISPIIQVDKKFIEPAGMRGIIFFPRFMHANGYVFAPAYGVLKDVRKNRPFLLRVNEEKPHLWDLILMFPDNINANEFAIIDPVPESAPNILMALIRSEDSNHMLHSYSYDMGSTWEYPRVGPIKGGPPHLLRLKDGRILCTYGYRHESMEIRASVWEHDKGWGDLVTLRDYCGYPCSLAKIGWRNRWRIKKDHKFAETVLGQNMGYPVSIQLRDESILTVYYATMEDGATGIYATKWEV